MVVIDDDPSIRLICREVLELGGYQVRDAGSATAALTEARRFRPDMIVLDVLMPGIDGYRTAEMIRADPSIDAPTRIFVSPLTAPHGYDVVTSAGTVTKDGSYVDLDVDADTDVHVTITPRP